MKTLNTVLKKTVIASLLLTSMTAFAADDSGDGRSGDDQAGVSIPAQMDHQLTEAKLVKAYGFCQKNEFKSILSQILRTEANKIQHNKHWNDFILVSTQTNGGVKTLGLTLTKDMSGNSRTDLTYLVMSTISDFQIDYFERSQNLKFTADAYQQISPEVFSSLERLDKNYGGGAFTGGSQIQYEVDVSRFFDELGNSTDTKIIRSINLITQEKLSRLVWINGASSLKPLDIAVSREDFKQCLEEQLVK